MHRRVPGIAIALLLAAAAQPARAQRLLGLDVSAWQQNISQTTWNNLRVVENRQFVFIRSSRGGTTGYYDQTDANNTRGANTLSQRYDDPYFVQNINRATTAGIFAGSYHFSRPDIVEGTLNSGGIRNSGTDEADHFIQMAGPWMRPGYLVPIHDLEAGDGIRTDDQMAQFSIDFSNRIYQRMGIRPGIYINGNYAANILQTASASLRDQLARPAALRPSVIAPAYPTLWVARWPNQADPNAIDVQGTNPKDTYSGFYGPWDDYGDSNPWVFWQYASTARLQSFNNGGSNLDVNAVRGDLEFLKDQLVPAVWMNDNSGDWSALANWNSGQTPIAPVTGPGQVAPIGTQTLPTPRLPGAPGSGVTSGQHDTVILERPAANITVTLSSGAHNIRKLYMREGLDITGGSLTINYDPTYASNPAYPNAARSGPLSAQFSGPVTLSGSGSLTAHTLQVDANRVFTLSGGALNANTISLLSAAKILINGPVTINSGRVIGNGSIDLASGGRVLTIGNGPAEIDFSAEVPIVNGSFTKTGPGAMRITAPTATGATILDGTLLVDTALANGPVIVTGGTLGGAGTISGPVSVSSEGKIAPGASTAIGALTLNTPPTLGGTIVAQINRNNGAPTSDKLTLSTGTLTYSGTLAIENTGAPLIGGETFTLFSAPAYTGNFTAATLPPLNPGLYWDLTSLPTNGTIAIATTPFAWFPTAPTSDESGAITLHLTARSGATYQIQRSTDLETWETISTQVAPATGHFQFTDQNPPQPAALYRVTWSE